MKNGMRQENRLELAMSDAGDGAAALMF